MKKNSTLFLMILSCSLFSTALKAQLKASFTLSYDTFCTSAAEHFVNTSTGGTKPYHTLWIFGDGDTSTSSSPSHNYSAGSYKVTLIVLDAFFDSSSSSKTITALAPPRPDLGPSQRGCWGQPIMLTTRLPHEPVVKWLWILGTDTVSTFHGDSITATDSGIYAVTVQNSAGCTGSDTTNIYFNPQVMASKVDTAVCVNSTVTLRAGSSGSYTWIDKIHNDSIVSTSSTFKFTASPSSGYGNAAFFETVIHVTGHGVTCVDTGYYNIKVNTPTQPSLHQIPQNCVNDPAFQLATGPPIVDFAHQGGNWVYPRKPSAIVNNFLYPSIMGVTTSPTYIHYIYTNGYQCITDDSVRVSINPLPPVSAGHDTEICPKTGKYLLSNSFVSPPGGAWYGLTSTPPTPLVYSVNHDSVFFDPNAVGVIDTVYRVVYSYTEPGAASCSNSDTVLIKVSANCNSGINPALNNAFAVSVYPNPFSSSATIQYILPKASNIFIGLYDINGKKVAQVTNETQAAGVYQAEINTGKYHLGQGVYLLKFMTDDGIISRQIIKL